MDEVPCAYAERLGSPVGVSVGRPRMEQVCDRFIILAPEDDVDYMLTMFRVSEFGRFLGMLGIELAETDFQRKGEKLFRVYKSFIRRPLFIRKSPYSHNILVYRGTPLTRRCCQPAGTLFPLR